MRTSHDCAHPGARDSGASQINMVLMCMPYAGMSDEYAAPTRTSPTPSQTPPPRT